MTPEGLPDPQGGSPDPNAGPVPEAPGTTPDWEVDDNPYKQRFESYRREADRKATEFTQYQSLVSDLSSDDPSKRAAAAEALGVELVEDEYEPDDPYEAVQRKLADLEGKLTAREQQEQERQQRERLSAAVEQRLDKLGLSDEADESGWSEKDWVLARAIQMPDEDGLPNIAAAHAELKKLEAAVQRRREAEWKRSKNAPRGIQPGSTATQQKNVADMSREERVEYMAQLADERATA